jgi:hypothetical protein
MESLTTFPEEYKDGKNLFALASVFENINMNDERQFSDAVDVKCNELKSSFKKLYIEEEDNIKTHVDLESAITVFGEKFTEIILAWRKQLSTPYDRTRFERAITIFYLLMISPLLSRHFKLNFLNNFTKKVYNGKIYKEKDMPYSKDGQTMLSELFRLFSKSASHHYYVINPLPYSPVHYIWESFKKRNLIHTILGLSSEFNHLFHAGSWDSLLLVSETGSLLNFLHRIEHSERLAFQERCSNKRIILICSYEAIRQLYPGTYDIRELIIKHKRHVGSELEDGSFVLDHLTILLVNFNQHNHHVTIFLKSISSENYDESLGEKFTIITNGKKDTAKDGRKPAGQNGDVYYFNAIGSFYNYRRGFSNSIDPIHIGLVDKETTGPVIHRDQEKMLDIFVLHLKKAFNFEFIANIEGPVWDKEDFLETLQEEYKSNPEVKYPVDKFLLSLYKKVLV